MASSFGLFGPFASPPPAAPAATGIEDSDPLGRVTRDLVELFATNSPSESITQRCNHPSSFGPLPSGPPPPAGMFDMSKFDQPPPPELSTAVDRTKPGLFGPSSSFCTQEQQRGFNFHFSKPPSSATPTTSLFGFQHGDALKPATASATADTSVFGGEFSSSNPFRSADRPALATERDTGNPPYVPFADQEIVGGTACPVTSHSICAMPAYAAKSPEELRSEDYEKRSRGVAWPVSSSLTGFGTVVKAASSTTAAADFGLNQRVDFGASTPSTTANAPLFGGFGGSSSTNSTGLFSLPPGDSAPSSPFRFNETQEHSSSSGSRFHFGASAPPAAVNAPLFGGFGGSSSTNSTGLFGAAPDSSARQSPVRFGEAPGPRSSGCGFGGQSLFGQHQAEETDRSSSGLHFGPSSGLDTAAVSFGQRTDETAHTTTTTGVGLFRFGAAFGSRADTETTTTTATSVNFGGTAAATAFKFGAAPDSFGSRGGAAVGFSFGCKASPDNLSSNSSVPVFGQPQVPASEDNSTTDASATNSSALDGQNFGAEL